MSTNSLYVSLYITYAEKQTKHPQAHNNISILNKIKIAPANIHKYENAKNLFNNYEFYTLNSLT